MSQKALCIQITYHATFLRLKSPDKKVTWLFVGKEKYYYKIENLTISLMNHVILNVVPLDFGHLVVLFLHLWSHSYYHWLQFLPKQQIMDPWRQLHDHSLKLLVFESLIFTHMEEFFYFLMIKDVFVSLFRPQMTQECR